MKISEVIHIIEKIAPPHLAASWDNCGIQVASLNEDIQRMALCLDPTPEAMHKAVACKADFVLSHHPLLMQGRLPNKVDAFHEVLRTLMQHDMTLYAAHTSLDVNTQGPAGWLARALALNETNVLDAVGSFENIDGNLQECGYGIVGNLPLPISYAELMDTLQKYLDLETATLSGPVIGSNEKNLRRLAYCPGSGSSFMHKAHALGADIYITGDVKYHFALESPLCMLDVGHHSLEEKMMHEYTEVLKKHLPELHIEFIPSVSPLRSAVHRN